MTLSPRSLGAGSIDAPAKINVTLEILARRDDGYHNLRSLMLPIALSDEVRWEPAKRFQFEGESRNLVARAFQALGIEPPLAVSLHKRIPIGAGLGGGSSDAAAVLRAAAAGAFGDDVSHDRDYLAIARSLGSDVPFFLVETGALVEGTGERVTAAGALPDWWVVVLVPPAAVSTVQAYAALDEARAGGYESRPRNAAASLAALEALQRADFDAVLAAGVNDFEAVIAPREPQVAAALAALRDAGAKRPMLSGSGSATFALAPTRDAAEALAAGIALPRGARVHVVPLAHSPAWRRAQG
ncbi:MAG: 4-(cytidine 5'-diphospho)-2-C-methyl-D-erythritol kinase [Candidatus Eremiobacteraeota bacterium]|nr:4-(cytidine 5'-diphospho)-2-C-methyl-D-erythritol kinase [Candidatus Eremiobacteraeota bacterium]